jgi:branched-chain amino acid transport system permease protein
MGFSLVYSCTKFVNLTHGMVAAAGGYIVFYLAKILGLDMSFSIIFGVLSAGILGQGLNMIIFEPLKRRRSSNTVLLVASLGAMIVIQSLLAIFFTSQFQTLGDSNTIRKIYIFSNIVVTQAQIVILLSALVSFATLASILKFTKFGKMARAINDNEEAATIVGINTEKIIRWLFFLGSTIAGLAGILAGFDTGLQPTIGMNLLIKGYIATVIGGIGSIKGALIGSLILGIAENFGTWKVSGEWKDAIAFILLTAFLLFRPRGVFKK